MRIKSRSNQVTRLSSRANGKIQQKFHSSESSSYALYLLVNAGCFDRFRWYHNRIKHLIEHDNQTIVKLVNVSEKDAGIYTCRVSNAFGISQINISLSVTGKASITSTWKHNSIDFSVKPRFTFYSDGNFTGIASRSIFLPCNHASSPAAMVIWSKNDQVKYIRSG
jgi:hypothetical protein